MARRFELFFLSFITNYIFLYTSNDKKKGLQSELVR